MEETHINWLTFPDESVNPEEILNGDENNDKIQNV